MDTRLLLAMALLVAAVAGTDRVIKVNDIFGSLIHYAKKKFSPALTCDEGVEITGFRVKAVSIADVTKAKLTAIEMVCQDGKKLGPVGLSEGVWQDWKFCDGQEVVNTKVKVIGFNMRSYEKKGATQIKMKCSNNKEIEDGYDRGSWGKYDYSGCPATSNFCGYAASVDTREKVLERLKFLCCSKAPSALKANNGWIPFGQDVCIGTRNENYGFLKVPTAGLLTGIKFEWLDGSVTCYDRLPHWESNFGCSINNKRERAFSIFVTGEDDEKILPDQGNIPHGSDTHRYYYVQGKDARYAKEFSLFAATPRFVNQDRELRFWYGEDYFNSHDKDNGDKRVCVNIYGKLA